MIAFSAPLRILRWRSRPPQASTSVAKYVPTGTYCVRLARSIVRQTEAPDREQPSPRGADDRTRDAGSDR